MYDPGSYPSVRWAYVQQRFTQFLENLKITTDQAKDGEIKHCGVVSTLNKAYWHYSSATDNRILIGSWGKYTRVRPPRDVDLIFVLPLAVHARFEQRIGNRQSQLLQEVKEVLTPTNPRTRLRADGQVVVMPFDTYEVEVAPGFPAQGGGYLICDANDGGRYKWVHPEGEKAELDSSDHTFNGNVRKLTRMLKQWQRHCDVPIKSFHIEKLMQEMLRRVRYGGNSEFWFDWLIRDAFQHMIQRANQWFWMPITNEPIFLGDAWLSKAQTAFVRAQRACIYEDKSLEILAGEEWQKIFGTMIPKII